ncbi:1,2-phenylacetyl-CoA epoxidase subunit PaaC [Virgibacillus siamensis]|uniref:1,2-phenylacetyl-CoA epoxidase subunit PaaC n=1 Tax=Virgibacillus siamensis TaxID=480071 RepID=UPI0009874357|nr:1,2-phenylacetyl-CoA epoxidase subunit PaaC [Virgibacillus siamensis]
MERGEEIVTDKVESAEQAKQNKDYLNAITELLYQLADDEFIVAFRGSEWLGLAPHIEEDVAFSSITQNTMGHANMYFALLEELGEGEIDFLAHERPAEERRNAVFLEKRNGDGNYLEEPYFDWALAVVRQYFYETLKKIKLEALTESSYVPLANVARKVLMEQIYHLAHWKLWMQQLQHSSEEAHSRIQTRVEEAWGVFGDAFKLGPKGPEIVNNQLIASEEFIKKQWKKEVESVLVSPPAGMPECGLGNGRNQEHTADIHQAIATFSEVYASDKKAVW